MARENMCFDPIRRARPPASSRDDRAQAGDSGERPPWRHDDQHAQSNMMFAHSYSTARIGACVTK